MAQNPLYDTDRTIKLAFAVTIGVPFQNYEQQILWSTQINKGGGSPTNDPVVQAMINAAKSANKNGNVFYSRRKCRDASLGGNDAINPYMAYCKTDDIIHTFLKTDYGNTGMGRRYSDSIDDTQQLLHMTAGVPIYNSLAGFFSNAVVPNLANMMNKGSDFGIRDIGYIAGTLAVTFIALPLIPLMFIDYLYKRLTTSRITKYYDLKPQMDVYYRLWNQLNINLSVNMGLMKDNKTTGSTSSRSSYSDLADAAVGSGSLPPIFRDAGMDIYRILQKQYYFRTGTFTSSTDTTDQVLLNKVGKGDNGKDPTDTSTGTRTWYEEMFDSGYSALFSGSQFVSYRVEKSTDASESFSSTTGESPVQSMLNAKADAARNMKHAIFNGNMGDGAIADTIETFVGGLTGVFQGALNAVNLGGVSHLLTGAGRIDIPEIWLSSSFSKSYNFNIVLRSTYATPISIMQRIYIPLTGLMAMALPRAVGNNSYTSPFLIRAYSKGLFAVPLGIIDSMTIKRGADQFGWSFNRLPTVVEVSFTIKDLSPVMYMGLGGEGILDGLGGENSSMNEYLMTLSGMGLQERLNMYTAMRRRWDVAVADIFYNKLNPAKWGLELANTAPARLLAAVLPPNGLPVN